SQVVVVHARQVVVDERVRVDDLDGCTDAVDRLARPAERAKGRCAQDGPQAFAVAGERVANGVGKNGWHTVEQRTCRFLECCIRCGTLDGEQRGRRHSSWNGSVESEPSTSSISRSTRSSASRSMPRTSRRWPMPSSNRLSASSSSSSSRSSRATICSRRLMRFSIAPESAIRRLGQLDGAYGRSVALDDAVDNAQAELPSGLERADRAQDAPVASQRNRVPSPQGSERRKCVEHLGAPLYALTAAVDQVTNALLERLGSAIDRVACGTHTPVDCALHACAQS